MTCCSEAKDDPTKRAGVCLACSLTCHENHDLVELYTKRNFKCDCGNPKFNSHPCQFTPDKTDLNDENNYNQNFSGVYCVCQRPYPDPESPTDVEMIQCIVCEDWLHATHLEATVPDSDQYSEMICKGCMEKNEFLHDYSNFAVNIDVDVVTNGIDDKICNGDTKLEAAKDETVKDSEETNDETKESPSKKIDDEKSAPMETEEKEPTQNEDSTENTDENKTPNVDNENESNNKEQENDAEPEKIEKNAEQLEEEKLLADPDDVTKNSEENGDIKKDEPEQNVENTETPKDENDTIKDGEQEKQLEEKVDKDSTAEEKSADDQMKDPNDEPNVTEESKPEGMINGEHNKITEKRKLSTEEDNDPDNNKKPKLEDIKEACVRPKGVPRVYKGATFWPSTFRQKLCTCRECVTMYKDLSVLFLIDPEDTVTAYENLGKQKSNGRPASQYEKGLAALSSLDRIQQINALTEYNKMRDKLLDFLKSFKDRREVVKEEDIKAFFAGMKPKREPDGVYFCR